MKTFFIFKKRFLVIMLLMGSILATAHAAVRFKDLITIKGIRDNPIIGHGLVIGLNGTGDSPTEITNGSLKKMLQKLGLNPQQEVASKNVAAVVVSAKLPSFARLGQKIDVTISSIGDASSLAGGTLIVTPLKGGDDAIYAIAHGAVSVGGLDQGKKMGTTARIPLGATVEKELAGEFDRKKSLRLSLNHPDFTTAARMEKIINQELGGKFALAHDAATIDLMIPPHYDRNLVQLVAILENFKVDVDQSAKIVINERTGTIVAGGDVVLKPVAITHGNLTVEIAAPEKADGKDAKEENFTRSNMLYLPEENTLESVVQGLRQLGASNQDLISILQALKNEGSLIGELEII
jgi:flagellar P-ring protein precursor FlgI